LELEAFQGTEFVDLRRIRCRERSSVCHRFGTESAPQGHGYLEVAMATCGWCGATSEPAAEPTYRASAESGAAPDQPAQVGDDEVPLGWMLEVDSRAGRRVVICPACARENVRAIEGKLDQAWW
jgi:hypothetical protein